MNEIAFSTASEQTMQARFAIFPKFGEFCIWRIWQQCITHAHSDQNIAGSNYITMSHQLLVEVRVISRIEISFPFRLESRKNSWKGETRWAFFVRRHNEHEISDFSPESRLVTPSVVTHHANTWWSVHLVLKPSRWRHHREWFKIEVRFCSLFRMRRSWKRVVRCHKTASNGRLSRSPAVPSKNQDLKKEKRC